MDAVAGVFRQHEAVVAAEQGVRVQAADAVAVGQLRKALVHGGQAAVGKAGIPGSHVGGDAVDLQNVDGGTRLELAQLLQVALVGIEQVPQGITGLVEAQHHENVAVLLAAQQGPQVHCAEILVGGGGGEHLEHRHAHVSEVVGIAQPGIVGHVHHPGVADEQGVVEKALVLAVYGVGDHHRRLRLGLGLGFRFGFRFGFRVGFRFGRGVFRRQHPLPVGVVPQHQKGHGDGPLVVIAAHIVLQLSLHHQAAHGGGCRGDHQDGGQRQGAEILDMLHDNAPFRTRST